VRDVARASRAGLVAFAVIAVSVVAHVLAGGAAHLASPLFAVFAVAAFFVCMRMSRHEWTVPRLVAVLGISQIVLHYAINMTMSMAEPSMTAMNSPMPSPVVGMADPAIAQPVSLLDSAGPMVFAHLVAIAIATVLVLHSERFISALEALLTYVIPAFAEPAAAPNRDAWTRLPVRPSSWVPAFVLRDARISRRGPPNAWVPTPPAFA
jgi:hypothetical protein